MVPVPKFPRGQVCEKFLKQPELGVCLGGARALERPPQGVLTSCLEEARVTDLGSLMGPHDAAGPRGAMLSEDTAASLRPGGKQRQSSDHRQPRSTQPSGRRLPPHQALLILTQPGAQNSGREQRILQRV